MRRLVSNEGAAALTRVDFSVAAHTIGIHNALEAGGEAVGPDEGRRHILAGYAVSDSTHSCLALGCMGRKAEANGIGFRNAGAPTQAQLRLNMAMGCREVLGQPAQIWGICQRKVCLFSSGSPGEGPMPTLENQLCTTSVCYNVPLGTIIAPIGKGPEAPNRLRSHIHCFGSATL